MAIKFSPGSSSRTRDPASCDQPIPADRAPSVYLEDRINALVAGNVTRPAAVASLKALLAEHLVDEAAWEALLHDDYEAFLAARAAAVRGRLGQLGIAVVYAPGEGSADGLVADEPVVVDEPVDTDEVVEA